MATAVPTEWRFPLPPRDCLQTARDGDGIHSQNRTCGASASLHMMAAETPQAEKPGDGVVGMGTPNVLSQLLLGSCVERVEIQQCLLDLRDMVAIWWDPSSGGIFGIGPFGEAAAITQKHSCLGRWAPRFPIKNSCTQASQPGHWTVEDTAILDHMPLFPTNRTMIDTGFVCNV